MQEQKNTTFLSFFFEKKNERLYLPKIDLKALDKINSNIVRLRNML